MKSILIIMVCLIFSTIITTALIMEMLRRAIVEGKSQEYIDMVMSEYYPNNHTKSIVRYHLALQQLKCAVFGKKHGQG